MNEKRVSIVWGILLVVLGLWILVSGVTSIEIEDPYLGMALTGGLSALFFASYFASGTQRWGWLFPACIFAGTTLTIVLSLLPIAEGGWLAAPVLLGIAAPFLVRYLQEPQTRRWALIPVYVLVALSLVSSLADVIAGELIGTLVLLSIGLPFLAIYLQRPERKWPLIPFGVLAAISIIPLLTLFTSDDAIGFLVLFFFAIPFGVVYMLNPRSWWALIPAGGFATIGVVVLIATIMLEDRPSGDVLTEKIVGGVLFLGWGLTFLALWLRRASARTGWAIYPAAALGLLALVTFILGEDGLNYALPIAIITGGLLLLYRGQKKGPAEPPGETM